MTACVRCGKPVVQGNMALGGESHIDCARAWWSTRAVLVGPPPPAVVECDALRAENERLRRELDNTSIAIRVWQGRTQRAEGALRALVDVLPKCDAVGCNRPATACSHGPQWCDEHNTWDSPWGKAEDVVCAEPLRRALAVLGEP